MSPDSQRPTLPHVLRALRCFETVYWHNLYIISMYLNFFLKMSVSN
jgi:hypothetical protein